LGGEGGGFYTCRGGMEEARDVSVGFGAA